jgi:hypothetical protein
MEVKMIKKDFYREKILLELEYNLFKMIIALSFRILGVLLGIFFLLAFENNIVKIISLITILFFLADLLSVLLFQQIVFTDNGVRITFSLFLENKYYEYSIVRVMKSNGTIFGGGSISFYDKRKKYINIFGNIDLFPVSTNDINQIKNILIEKKVIKGDEYEWNN